MFDYREDSVEKAGVCRGFVGESMVALDLPGTTDHGPKRHDIGSSIQSLGNRNWASWEPLDIFTTLPRVMTVRASLTVVGSGETVHVVVIPGSRHRSHCTGCQYSISYALSVGISSDCLIVDPDHALIATYLKLRGNNTLDHQSDPSLEVNTACMVDNRSANMLSSPIRGTRHACCCTKTPQLCQLYSTSHSNSIASDTWKSPSQELAKGSTVRILTRLSLVSDTLDTQVHSQSNIAVLTQTNASQTDPMTGTRCTLFATSVQCLSCHSKLNASTAMIADTMKQSALHHIIQFPEYRGQHRRTAPRGTLPLRSSGVSSLMTTALQGETTHSRILSSDQTRIFIPCSISQHLNVMETIHGRSRVSYDQAGPAQWTLRMSQVREGTTKDWKLD
ncbi:hypothetical protein B0O80DRAFT_426396 [Mortierella sp. GBAus27b]|nr:hypothetical protein B0O80DRAFT_426396 [Mortierella sp. GBAus27b]